MKKQIKNLNEFETVCTSIQLIETSKDPAEKMIAKLALREVLGIGHYAYAVRMVKKAINKTLPFAA